MLTAMTLGEKIAAARVARMGIKQPKKPMTQGDVARFMDVESNTAARWEQDRTVPSFEDRMKLAAFLGVPGHDFMLPHEIEAMAAPVPASRVVLDDEYEALPGDLEKVWVAYSELDDAHRDRLRRQRWDGGPPALADLMTRAASLLAIQKGKAVVSKAPVLKVEDDPDAPRFR
jgi:transcriptional regulator with XRE-family HTH domain